MGRPRKYFNVQLINETHHNATIDCYKKKCWIVKGKITLPICSDVEEISKKIESLAEQWLVNSTRHIVEVKRSEWFDKRAKHTHITYVMVYVIDEKLSIEEMAKNVMPLIERVDFSIPPQLIPALD